MLLYADENVPLAVIEELQRLEHDVLTAYEDGRANQAVPDDKVLLRATELGRAVLTFNRQDYKRLHGAHPQHAGIVAALTILISPGKPHASIKPYKTRQTSPAS